MGTRNTVDGRQRAMPNLVTFMPTLSPKTAKADPNVLRGKPAMPRWNAPTLAASALMTFYLFYGVRGALGDNSVVPNSLKSANLKLTFVQALGYHMLMDACLIGGVVMNDIAHVMMPTFVAAMLVEVFKHFIIDDLPGAAPVTVFALVFACLTRGAPARKPMKWNLATIFFSLQGLLLLLGIGMLFGDDSVIPEQVKPLELSQLKLIGTTELTLAAYFFGSILTGHAQAMQPFCGLFLLVGVVLHVVIGDIEGCPMIVGLALPHICLGLFWKGKSDAKEE